MTGYKGYIGISNYKVILGFWSVFGNPVNRLPIRKYGIFLLS